MRHTGPALLCVVNYPANTGFAWNFIEGLYAKVSRHAASAGRPTFVAYPHVGQPPRPLEGSPAHAVEVDATLRSFASLVATARLVRRERVRTVYFTDLPSRRLAHLWLRAFGVRRIVVHDHTSGARSVPRGARQLLKWIVARVPGVAADVVVTVSDYVAARQRDTVLMPASRVVRVWNGIPLPERPTADSVAATRTLLGLPLDRPVIVCACRAAEEKGVQHLIGAFARVASRQRAARRPLLVYVGDGPYMGALTALRDASGHAEDIVLAGYSDQVQRYLAAADLCVIPSVWADALPLGVIEPMALGRPVIASRTGGIPEMARDGREGLLVAPADEQALADAIDRLLRDEPLRRALGEAGRRRVAEHFTVAGQVDALAALLDLPARADAAVHEPMPVALRT